MPKKWFQITLVAFVALTLSLPAAPAEAKPASGKSKLSRQIQGLADQGGNELVNVLITYKKRPGNSDKAHVSTQGASVGHSFNNFPVQLVSIKAGKLHGLSHNPNIDLPESSGLDPSER